MSPSDIVLGLVVLTIVFSSGFWCGRMTAPKPPRRGELADLWAYYRVLNDAARDVGRLKPGEPIGPGTFKSIAQARKVAAKQARGLPAESQWVLDPKSIPGADGVSREPDDVGFILVCMAEEIRTKLERRAAEKRAPRVVPERRVGDSRHP